MLIFNKREQKLKLIQLALFVVTLLSTTAAGAEWMTGRSILYGDQLINIEEFLSGLRFSIPFLLILSCHEFGHYFTAVYHKVKVTLPFYIPLWLGFLGTIPSIGTMGAVINIRQNINNRKKYFDIGIAGPMAGFIVAIPILIFGFVNLPGDEYIFNIHPEYREYGSSYADHVYSYKFIKEQQYPVYLQGRAADSLNFINRYESIEGWTYPPYRVYTLLIQFGKPLIYTLLEEAFANESRIPHINEQLHYPILTACLFAFVLTALNLFPIGQLDGGHILYGLIGAKHHRRASRIIFIGLLYYSGLGVITPFNMSGLFAGGIFSSLSLFYIPLLYLSFYKFTPHIHERLIYALGILSAQMATSYVFPSAEGYQGWLIFAFVLGRFLGIYHPNVENDAPLDTKRKVIGAIAMLVFVLCFSPRPLIIPNRLRFAIISGVYSRAPHTHLPLANRRNNPEIKREQGT